MPRIAFAAAVLAVAAFAVWHPAPRPGLAPAPPSAFSPRPRHTRPALSGAPALVYVAGAVRSPGLYTVKPGARVADAVRLAGGLRPDADPLAVNLAARVQDGDEVAVVKAGEAAPSSRAAHARRRPRSPAAKRAAAPAEPVNVNAADARSLATVPGIGSVIAQRIVAIRLSDGPYETLDELLDVAGMTQARLDRARPYLAI